MAPSALSETAAPISGRGAAGSSVGGTVPSTTTLVSCCGNQKIGASGGAMRGSTGKSQPPLISDFFRQHLPIGVGAAERLEIMVVIAVAAQPLPGEVGCGDIVDMIVVRRQVPLGWSGVIVFVPSSHLIAGRTRFLGKVDFWKSF